MDDWLPNEVRERLRIDLFARKVSVTELADELGYSRGHLSSALSGRTPASLELWKKIAAKVGKRLDVEVSLCEEDGAETATR